MIKSILIFLLLNLFWISLLYLSMGIFYKKKNPDILYIFLFVFGIVAVVLSIVAVLDYTETEGFCADTCHPMADYGDSYEDAEEGTIMATHREEEVNCADCHNKPGIVGTVKSKYAGVMEVIIFVTGSYEEPLHNPEVGEEFCAKSGCHDDVDWLIASVGANSTLEDEPDETEEGWIDHRDLEDYDMCNDCHAPHQEGIKLKPRGCTVCHDVTEDDLEAHEDFIVEGDRFLVIVENVTEVTTCSDCHETMDNIPYESTTPNEFCESCHDDEFDAYTENVNANQTAVYGGCADCHVEHKEKQEPHPTVDEIDCVTCHATYTEDITIHNPTEVRYGSVGIPLGNEFCSDCHEDQFEAYEGNSTPAQVEFYGGCVGCHPDHDEANTKESHLVLEDVDCQNCHGNYDEDIQYHDPSGVQYSSEVSRLDNDFCSSCHVGESSAYTGNLTFKQAELYGENCVDCHSDHDEKKEVHSTPEGLNCDDCHTNRYEEIATHDPSQISYRLVSSQLDGDFCKTCHEDEFDAYYENEIENAIRLKRYGDCSSCHSDHDVQTRPHSSETKYENCIECHTSYNEDLKTHTLNDVDYGSMDIENEFCSSCHTEIYDGFSKGSIQDQDCVDCHSSHKVNIASANDNCSNCHSNFKYDHNP